MASVGHFGTEARSDDFDLNRGVSVLSRMQSKVILTSMVLHHCYNRRTQACIIYFVFGCHGLVCIIMHLKDGRRVSPFNGRVS